MTTTNSRWLTVAEVCSELGVSRRTFDKWRARGVAPRAKRLPKGQLRITTVWLEELMKALPEEAA